MYRFSRRLLKTGLDQQGGSRQAGGWISRLIGETTPPAKGSATTGADGTKPAPISRRLSGQWFQGKCKSVNRRYANADVRDRVAAAPREENSISLSPSPGTRQEKTE
mmetsp:Transcript_28583/g.72440  ORF Transcript_28583/g.72440 Transcript_28583/m.72440 type:complete len:107 (-) Transcript_28583:936-1256(-)|eukprot:CAMPEP_0178995534 /NCGR_PEP_ID=MMETSP0795-20121207/7876_1 /TAXON_ID=88552 /ORGANISM="Amoebophrya sp., Strain Ameob2" /LENGTH=106 /DNA_ID=CAMNT_0020687843 /DNA_START=122 /DNA_END=442 /DNA_ORIENTATION=+